MEEDEPHSMDVFYEREKLKKSTSLQRQAQRIGAVPTKKQTENFNYLTTYSTTANSWSFLLLNGLTQGTSGSQRVGREIFMTSLDMYVQSQTLSRYCIVYDKQSNGSAFTASDLFQDSTDAFSPYNFSNRQRFRVINDSLYNTTPEQAIINRFYGLPINESTFYNVGNAGTIADIASGSLYFIAYATGTAAIPFSLSLYYEE